MVARAERRGERGKESYCFFVVVVLQLFYLLINYLMVTFVNKIQ